MGVYTGSPALPLLLAGDIPNAASDWAAILAELNALSTAWTTWSPTLANLTLGNGSVSAKYRQVGKTVNYRFKFTLGSTSAVGTGPTFTLPVAPDGSFYAADDSIGIFTGIDAATNSYPGVVLLVSGSTIRMKVYNAAGTYVLAADITSTVPFTWGSGDILLAEGLYTIA